jgi:hypothetical protein
MEGWIAFGTGASMPSSSGMCTLFAAEPLALLEFVDTPPTGDRPRRGVATGDAVREPIGENAVITDCVAGGA